MSCKAFVRWFKWFRTCESGSAMVETALTFPLFVALLLGAVELGDLAYKANEITNAARSAAQYAASTGGGYTDCDGRVPDTTTHTCTSARGIYITAQKDAPLVTRSCTSFTVEASTSCICSDNTACAFSATSAGYTCGKKPVIMVSVHTSAQCSPAASVPNLFPLGSAFTINGYSQQEVTF
ncbi:MAG TPA: TadE family protein [Terracidiphilus sp.]|nr:TadE family protein [Terracidiphilus sp.]